MWQKQANYSTFNIDFYDSESPASPSYRNSSHLRICNTCSICIHLYSAIRNFLWFSTYCVGATKNVAIFNWLQRFQENIFATKKKVINELSSFFWGFQNSFIDITIKTKFKTKNWSKNTDWVAIFRSLDLFCTKLIIENLPFSGNFNLSGNVSRNLR